MIPEIEPVPGYRDIVFRIPAVNDAEVEAIEIISTAIKMLSSSAKARVLRYLTDRYGNPFEPS